MNDMMMQSYRLGENEDEVKNEADWVVTDIEFVVDRFKRFREQEKSRATELLCEENPHGFNRLERTIQAWDLLCKEIAKVQHDAFRLSEERIKNSYPEGDEQLRYETETAK